MIKSIKNALYISISILFCNSSFAGDCNAPAAPGVDWSGCNKDGSFLRNANLANANLQNASFIGAFIVGINIDGASLDGTRWIGGEICAKNSVGRCYDGGETRYTNAADNNCIIDNYRGLMWPKSGNQFGSMDAENTTLNSALEKINRDQYCGYSDWKLPTSHELTSLYRGNQPIGNPGIWLEQMGFSNMQNIFWGTQNGDIDCPQDFVDFRQGSSGCAQKNNQFYLLPVHKML
jgi:hypothetical protein